MASQSKIDTAAQSLESRAVQIGRELFSRVGRSSNHVNGSRWEQWLMDIGMRDERVKAQLFRFIDVLPTLVTPTQINQHLREYLDGVADFLPAPIGRAVQWIPQDGWLGDRFAGMTRFGATKMARRFIAAADLDQAIKSIHRMRARSLAFTIDLLGEAVLSESEAMDYQGKYIELIDGLSADAKNWNPIDLIDRDAYGPIPRVNVSVKLSSLFSQFDPIDPAGTDRAVLDRLRPILRLARIRDVFVNIDMEQYAYKDATLRMFRTVFSEEEFRDWQHVGIAIQAYLRDTGDDLRALADWARERGTPVWVRLVKGAYWDFESIVSAQNDWPLPVWSEKPETDANFELQAAFLMENHTLLRPALATHNIRSIAKAIALAEKNRVPLHALEFQMLYGMAEPVKAALAAMKWRVRVYTPFGELLPGMAYLVRRLLENTSNESFLRAGFHDHLPEEQLLMNPMDILRRRHATSGSAPRGNGDEEAAPYITPFKNEPLTDFSRDLSRRAMEDAIKWVAARIGGTYPLVIGGQRIESGNWIVSINPSHRTQIIGRSAAATIEQAKAAVEAAKKAFPAWRDTPAGDRAGMLFRCAEIFRRRRFELTAWEIFETAKPWREADADVAEAIDYCEYYAREMIRLSVPKHNDLPGEENAWIYDPRGVVVTIAPWNFPLAILTGMTTAALVTGNAVIMKPAEQSPIIAAKLMEVFYEAGIPDGVVNYLPGFGETVGPVLVQHPDVSMIAFTGSRAVGLAIQQQAAQTAPGQEQVKRVITEMGGKNAIIVDDDADLDDAIHGVVASAFGYAGQKCSACSRVIVMNSIYDAFMARLVEAARSLKVGPAEDPGTLVGPVIDEEAQLRILNLLAKTRGELTLAYSADFELFSNEGFYVPPTIFAGVPPTAPIAQEEIFGPVLVVMKAADLTEALSIANGTPYALTGGLYSRSPAHIERVRHEFRVGNLYINRKITGALVSRQPFGGMKLSGVGSISGGPDYLPQFLVPRTITENTMRHGFAPQSTETPAAERGGE
ncbi:MAG TPA: L-glutamate gamma-semialdehyde dehydrogenase [Tepidisphaeraceae bacterium]|jgi:RHH-type proline utilization regulon transcriptional repressor/proline dehydrogenase/delta 1-pyrroline-5-carboxylate dehydrogenase|nr:L-glutamate gamma-semialdehyde dehydrogenase [Tepidisphaeraceae bacterium]